MSLDDWKRDATERINRNLPVFPDLVEQLDWLVEHYPDQARPCLPRRSEMRHFGKPACYGREQPFSETWRERLVRTAIEDADFSTALMVALRMRGVA